MSETMPISRGERETHWIPASRAAKLLKVSRQRIYQLLRDGLISGQQVDRTWLISARSVDARLALLRLEGGE